MSSTPQQAAVLESPVGIVRSNQMQPTRIKRTKKSGCGAAAIRWGKIFASFSSTGKGRRRRLAAQRTKGSTPDGSTWDHEYVITDHLGNTRVRFHDDNGDGTISSGELLSTHDYYPFGMEWNAGSYPYTYNGKEQNGELGLDWLEERGMTARQVEYRELTDFFSVEKRKDGEPGQADPSGGSPLLRELRHRQEPGCRPGRKPDKINPIIYERLFFSENGSDSIKNSLLHLFRAIKRRYPKITSAKAIRSAVIAEWLKTKDIRIVQYMAGHRWVSSTERYNAFNLQELKDSLKRHHPLGVGGRSHDEGIP